MQCKPHQFLRLEKYVKIKLLKFGCFFCVRFCFFFLNCKISCEAITINPYFKSFDTLEAQWGKHLYKKKVSFRSFYRQIKNKYQGVSLKKR